MQTSANEAVAGEVTAGSAKVVAVVTATVLIANRPPPTSVKKAVPVTVALPQVPAWRQCRWR